MRTLRLLPSIVAGLACALVVAACGTGLVPGAATGAAEPPSIVAGSAVPAPADAVGYCTEKGGSPTQRQAAWNTNMDPAGWLLLAGTQTFCEFEMGEGDEGTRISVDLVTLSGAEPTLAAIAYMADVRITFPPEASANPAEWSCTNDFLGTPSFGNGVSGGGWTDLDQEVFTVMVPCTFADGSSIDAFGLWYHANDEIRGADLAPLFAYQPGGELPAIYGTPRR